ncbi:hypothetical protein RHMOL_Rhmol06G0190300 [Rhododendron molle]|uniref:Uncharacterized protein n=1 Tax=Rhododendron molle TaxID=49168 RepID=A0ACC0NFX2_RHOML|nr:hypothetical protein RHMOL_Rhmol06G0190300 [Rhododendron molle]
MMNGDQRQREKTMKVVLACRSLVSLCLLKRRWFQRRPRAVAGFLAVEIPIGGCTFLFSSSSPVLLTTVTGHTSFCGMGRRESTGDRRSEGGSTVEDGGDVFKDLVGSACFVAPEVLRRSYGVEADIWSAGVILYILLSGVPPFWGENEQCIFDAVLRGNPAFASDPWPSISSSAKHLVKKMLQSDPKERLSATEVLKNLSEEEIVGLKEMFKTVDTDNSETVTFEKSKAGLPKLGTKLSESEVRQLMEAIPNHVAIQIALELKKLLIDDSLLHISQSDLEANLFKVRLSSYPSASEPWKLG